MKSNPRYKIGEILGYKFKLAGKSLFYATLIELVIAELLFQSDLFTIPAVFFMLPIAIVLYSLLTIVPFWIVEHNIVQNKGKVIVLVAVWLLSCCCRRAALV